MDQRLTIEYDKISDTLHIEKCPPYLDQDEDEIDDLVLGRRNPTTGDLESVAVLFFMARLEKRGSFRLPVTANFKTAIQADV